MSKKLLVRPQKTPLKGRVTVPGDKSISHRAVMLAAIAEGESVIRRWLPAGDTLATLEAIKAMGVHVEVEKKSPTAWDLQINGVGLYGLQPAAGPLDFKNAGTGIRLLAGIMVGQRFSSILDGSSQLRKRPMGRITEPLTTMGANITSTNGCAPMTIDPAEIKGTRYEMKVASGQVKSALLLAGLYADGDTAVYQPGPARDHTERMLRAMGVDIVEEDNWITLRKPADELKLQPFDLTVPSDISSAAFPIVAASIVPHSKIVIENVGMNETRTGILNMMKAMGANFKIDNERVTGGEPAADITVSFDELHSAKIRGELVVRGIDELPIWAVAASQAAGHSTVHDATELRVKEVDRIGVLSGELQKLGVDISEFPDGFMIHGPSRLYSAEVDSHDDHRLAMSLSVAGLVTHGMTMIENADCAADSFPGFVEMMKSLGATMEWIE